MWSEPMSLFAIPTSSPRLGKWLHDIYVIHDLSTCLVEWRSGPHFGSSDSVISLAKSHRGQEGRIHIAVNCGVGLHLAVCVLKEEANNGSIGGAPAELI